MGSSWFVARRGSWLRRLARTWEWRPSAPARSVPVAEEESEKCAVTEESASFVVNEVSFFDHCLL